MDIETIFKKYSDNLLNLKELAEKSKNVLTVLDDKNALEQLQQSLHGLDGDNFKILVVGEFKRGKSTFINALLGEEILPAYATPCTAVINEIKYSEEKKAVLHFVSPFPENISGLAPDVQKYVDQYKGAEQIPPMDIPIDRIEEFVVIPDPGKDQAESVSESPFSSVELYWPIDLCKNRVEIIDSPGLNEHKTRSKVTLDYLNQADAVIFVLSCSALASQSELKTISNTIIASGYEDIFFVCNRFDEVRERERLRFIDYAQKRLSDKTTLDNGIHFISALNALDAKLDKDEDSLEKSGFPKLEKDLVAFLVNNRGRLKLARPAQAIRQHLNKILRQTIPQRLNMLHTDFSTLQKKYDEEKPKLEIAEQKRKIVIEKMTFQFQQLKDSTRQIIVDYLNKIAQSVPDLVNGYEVHNEITNSMKEEERKEQVKLITEELSAQLEEDLSKKQNEWTESEFFPYLKQKIQENYNSTQIELDDFFKLTDSINLGETKNDLIQNQRSVPGWERIAAAGVGGFLFGIGSAIQAQNEGFKGLFKSAIPQLGVAVGLSVLGILNPFILIPSLLATSWLSIRHSNAKLNEKLRTDFGQKVQNNMLESVEENASTMIERLNQCFNSIIEEADNGLKSEIQTIKTNIEKIIEVKKDTESRIENEKKILAEQKDKAEKLVDEIEELVENF